MQTPDSTALTPTSCATCNVRSFCLPTGLDQVQLAAFDSLVQTRMRVKRGQMLFRGGDPFEALYAVRRGFFKTSMVTGEGREQVTGFQMAGDLLGMDCVGGTCYHTDAVALDDSEVCVIPYTSLQSLAQRLEPLQHNFHRAMGGEIRRDHRVMVFLGKNTADERVATFLVNLSQRFIALGYSRSNFILRMTREEIGDFLGLQLETVSRTFSKFHGLGLIRVQKRDIRITDLPELQKLGSQLQGSI